MRLRSKSPNRQEVFSRPMLFRGSLTGLGLVVFVLSGCAADGDTRISGNIKLPDNGPSTKITLSKAFFWPDPTDQLPNRVLVLATNVDTPCEDPADGLIDGGGFPKKNLVLFLSDRVIGTYDAVVEPKDTGKFFGGGLAFIESEHSYKELDILSGSFELFFITEAEMEGWIDVDLAGNQDGSGHLSGTVSASTCPSSW